MSSFKNMAKFVKTKRKECNMSQQQLSSAMGYQNGQMISNIERALGTLPLKSARDFCKAVKADPIELGFAYKKYYAGLVDWIMKDARSYISDTVETNDSL